MFDPDDDYGLDPVEMDPNDWDDARNDWIDEGPDYGDTESDLEDDESDADAHLWNERWGLSEDDAPDSVWAERWGLAEAERFMESGLQIW